VWGTRFFGVADEPHSRPQRRGEDNEKRPNDFGWEFVSRPRDGEERRKCKRENSERDESENDFH
jgi:hypothetical protein